MGPDIEGVTGPFFLGTWFNYGFLGILAIQVYLYSISFQNDNLALRILVYGVLIIDTLQTIFSTHYAWSILISDWGDTTKLTQPTWSISTLLPMAGIVSFAVQLFYAWRIWVLGFRRGAVKSKTWITIPAIIVITVTALASCVMSFTFGINLRGFQFVDGRLHILQPASITAWLSLSIICDVLITIVIVIQLRTSRNFDFKFINNILHRAIRMSIETGALAALVAIAEIILYLGGRSLYFFALMTVSGKIYSNSLLASLNSRAPPFRKPDHADTEVFQSSSVMTSRLKSLVHHPVASGDQQESIFEDDHGLAHVELTSA